MEPVEIEPVDTAPRGNALELGAATGIGIDDDANGAGETPPGGVPRKSWGPGRAPLLASARLNSSSNRTG
jgi:hypothetical protein